MGWIKGLVISLAILSSLGAEAASLAVGGLVRPTMATSISSPQSRGIILHNLGNQKVFVRWGQERILLAQNQKTEINAKLRRLIILAP